MNKANLPDKIYLVDPFDDDGQLVEDTENVCWCADPAGDVNVGYIAEATITTALNVLRAEWLGEQITEPQSTEESGINARIQRYVNDLDTTIAALLGGTESSHAPDCPCAWCRVSRDNAAMEESK